ncbi:MAG TPA: hypothetical protein VE954_41875 [Oligoflexus sp.]|uniref:hypothetical protein n=1 Tax=Oligoflexus sp. TaxID=1971216 RepID=UPI002D68E7A4|nr:hypothetical protein [Oligoflexus sp.]HYX39692.1 hypothetical protein [Oligoflexus sp.]
MRPYLIYAVLSLAALRFEAYASPQNQCLIEKSESHDLSQEEEKNLRDCFKKRNCTVAQTEKMCAWAQQEKSSSAPGYTPEQKEELENVCQQCDQIAIIACGYDFEAAQKRFNIFSTIFLSDTNKNKPLIFDFDRPGFKFSNLNINDNIAKIESDRTNYQVEYDKLLSDLSKLSSNVTTEAAVTANVKSAHTLISSFQSKWTSYFRNIEKLEDLFLRSNAILVDWQLRLLAMKADSYCNGYLPQINLGAKDNADLSSAFKKALDVISKSNVKHNLITLDRFTESAIKLNYVQFSKVKLEDLEKSIGTALKLESDLFQANIWWFNTSIGGLAGGLHTRYYQYREPLRLLSIAAAKGQEHIDLIKSNASAPSAALNRAIANQQQRLKLINDDINWLKERGWQGQFNDQKATIQSWLPVAKTSVCKQALTAFTTGASRVKDDIRDFESFAEPNFLNAMKVCEAAE